MTAVPLAPSASLAAAPLAWGPAFACERPEDAPLVEALVGRAFGPGRYAKTAERLREGNHPRLDLSVCAWADGDLVGVARQWPVLIGEVPAVFLGPFAVEAGARGQGLGAALIGRACALAQAAQERLVLLVGEASYFEPLGFERVPSGRAVLPGPVDPRRILWRPLAPGGLDGVSGPVRVPPER